MGRIDRIIDGLLKPINPYATIILGLLTATWGLWMVSPFWRVFTSAPLFSKMDAFAPEWAWGAWAFCCGMLIILAVWRGYYHALSFALGFAVWHWSTVAGMMWWGDWSNTGGLTYTFVQLWSLYFYLNIKFNYIMNDSESQF